MIIKYDREKLNLLEVISQDTLSLKKWRQEYSEGKPSVTDAWYDTIFENTMDNVNYLLKNWPVNLKKDFSKEVLENLPGNFVGYPETGDGKVRLDSFMGTIKSVYSLDELKKLKTTEYQGYLVEPKYDGVAACLTYFDGKLVKATTRGDGTHGLNITKAVREIESVPKKIPSKIGIKVVVKGEILIHKADFKKLNRDGEFSNARNMVAGTVRLKDMNKVRERKLKFYGYNFEALGLSAHLIFAKQTLGDLGFKSNPVAVYNPIETALEEVKRLTKKRDEFPFDMDGVVISRNIVQRDITLPFQNNPEAPMPKAPKHLLAFKFAPMKQVTRLTNITYQMGGAGTITPVGHIDPVNLGGTVVKKATLHSENFIVQNDLRIGDKIVVERAGDVIPSIKVPGGASDRSNHSFIPSKYRRLKKCPFCKGVIDTSGKRTLCVSKKCSERDIHVTLMLVKMHKLPHLGPQTVRKLFDMGILKSDLDLYKLTAEKLAPVPGMGPKKTEKIVGGIKSIYRNKKEEK